MEGIAPLFEKPGDTKMTRLSHTLILLLLPLLLPAQQRALTPAEKALWRIPTSPVLAPNAQHVAFTVRSADTATNSWLTRVWLLTEDGELRPMTSEHASCTSPAWSPDGSVLSFLSKRTALDASGNLHEDHVSLFGLPADGGEAHLLATLPRDIEEYTWSPDGNYIALICAGESSADILAELARREARKLAITVASDSTPGKQLWLLNVANASLRMITELDPGAEQFQWFPDGESLLYQTNYTGEYNDEQKFDLWSVALDARKTILTDDPGPETHPRVSPDGAYIAYRSQTVPDIEFAKTELSLLDLQSGNTRRLTVDAIHSVVGFEWMPDGKALLALFNEGSSAVLYRVDARNGALQRVSNPELVVAELSVSNDGRAVFTADSPESLRELYILDKRGITRHSSFSQQLADVRLGEQRVITIRSRDDLFDIEAVLVLPRGRADDEAVPLLLAYHGGPYGDFDNRVIQFYPVHILASKGIATVMPNIRGSSGYSDEFGQANRYDLGGGDYRDAMDVVDWLIAQGIADSTRLAVMGGSYGGYMSNWTISQTQRFKAAVSLYGIFSWLTDWSNTWQPEFEIMYFGHNYWERSLDMNNLWINRSPQAFVERIVTPTLILHGDKDVYTNIANSREMYQALKALNREVEFVIYGGAGHGLRSFPNQWIDSMERTVQWIVRHLGMGSDS